MENIHEISIKFDDNVVLTKEFVVELHNLLKTIQPDINIQFDRRPRSDFTINFVKLELSKGAVEFITNGTMHKDDVRAVLK